MMKGGKCVTLIDMGKMIGRNDCICKNNDNIYFLTKTILDERIFPPSTNIF